MNPEQTSNVFKKLDTNICPADFTVVLPARFSVTLYEG